MPIYEYECKCGTITELIQRISEPKPKTTKCKSCGRRAKAIISRSSFVLKGGGWYEDGYMKKKKPLTPPTTTVTPAETPTTSTSITTKV
jgi:putative FmdB family regulatory protein